MKGQYDNVIHKLPELFDHLKNIQEKEVQLNLKEVHNIWSRKRDKAITDLKNGQWELYKSIWNDGVSDLSTYDLLNANASAFTSFSPLIVVHESELMQLLSMKIDVADEVLFLDSHELSMKILKQTQAIISNITIATSYDINMSEGSSANLNVQSYYSSDLKMPNQSVLGVDPGSDRYHLILPLAAALSDIMKSVTIYRIAGEVILSFVDSQLNQLIEAEMGLQTQDIIYRDSNEISALVEVLMLDEKISIITENGLTQ